MWLKQAKDVSEYIKDNDYFLAFSKMVEEEPNHPELLTVGEKAFDKLYYDFTDPGRDLKLRLLQALFEKAAQGAVYKDICQRQMDYEDELRQESYEQESREEMERQQSEDEERESLERTREHEER